MTRSSASPRAADRRARPPAAHARAPLQDPRRDGGACSPICPRRSPRASRSPSAVPSGRSTRKPILPQFSAEAVDDDEAQSCASAPRRASTRRIKAHGVAPGPTEEDYRERLAFELGVIASMKYPGYFLIVADFIQWAKAQGIPVGPAAARAPARSSPMRSPSPTSTRSASASCSSASSIPSACRCPTSTSTSARTGATR